MSKVTGKPLAVEPSSPPSGAVDHSTMSSTNSASVNPLFMSGSTVPTASDLIGWTGTIALVLPTVPLEPMPPSRIWS
jgi:hypothetical protein